MDNEFVVTFALLIAAWTTFSPFLVSILKNIGGEWSRWAKNVVAGVMAVLGAVIAFAVTAAIQDQVVLTYLQENLELFLIGVFGAFESQYLIYSAIWEDSVPEVRAANFGNPDSGSNDLPLAA